MRGLPTLFCGLLCAAAVLAQDTAGIRIGGTAGVNLSLHSANISGVPGTPSCCPGFSTGIGWNPFIAATGELPISSNLLVSTHLGYTGASATLTRDEQTAIIVGGVLTPGTFTHTIDASLSGIAFDPYLKMLFGQGLFITGGLQTAYWLTSAFEQREEITEPANSGTFADASGNDTKSRIRNSTSGNLPDTRLHVALAAGVGIDLPLNAEGSLLLAPAITGSFALTSIANTNWKAHGIRLGLSLLYQRPRDVEPQLSSPGTTTTPVKQPPPPPPPVVVAAPLLFEADVVLQAQTARGTMEPVRKIVIEETISEQLTALLPYVFFDKGSAMLPARYQRGNGIPFNERHLFGRSALDVYHHILDIIGTRMQQYPKASIDLTGCIMPDDVETEASGLAANRAQQVKAYLTSRFGIDANRVRTSSVALPKLPSNVRTADGQQENRRVEISSSDPAIVDVLQIEDTLRTTATPTVHITLPVKSAGRVTSWKLRARQGQRLVIDTSAQDAPPASLNWEPLANRQRMPTTDEPIIVDFEVSNEEGRTIVRSDTIETEQITLRKKASRGTGTKRIDEYNLILFAFGKASLEGPNARIIELIKRRIEPSSIVIVRGHADRTGTPAVNDPLTQQRAEAVGKALNHSKVDAKGLGQREMLYDNDLPEGRFYNRTVRVRVETPIK